MKKLFGHSKAKPLKSASAPTEEVHFPTPIYQQHAVTANTHQSIPNRTPREGDNYGTVSPPTPSPNPLRASSPFHTSQTSITQLSKPSRGRDTQSPRRNSPPGAPAVSSILKSLEPPSAEMIPQSNLSQSEDNYSVYDYSRDVKPHLEKKEKKGFWGWERNKDQDRDRGRDRKEDASAAELARMIGYLTATASEDWALVLDVCDRASANEMNAREAVRTLRREFRYGEPPGQLSAARLWAIMLKNCSDVFITQSTSRKFLETLEDLLTSSRTSPVVRERLLDVIAAAAYESGSKRDRKNDRDGFRILWKRVKPLDKPDEGIPFEPDDAMFNPPVSSRLSQYESPILQQDPQPPTLDPLPNTLTPQQARNHKKRKSPTRNRIIPRDEDVRRLFQECTIGRGNANLLSQALVYAKPETFKDDPVITEFYPKCCSSQRLIFTQIEWATAEAEKAIAAKASHFAAERLKLGFKEMTESLEEEPTMEEQLLSAILAANGELLEVLKQYEDMERVAMERQAEDRSRKETRINRHELEEPPELHTSTAILSSNLAPPPQVPLGPRSRVSFHSRTPSPHASISIAYHSNGIQPRYSHEATSDISVDSDGNDVEVPVQPSAKALGKQKAVEADPVDEFNHYVSNDDRRLSHSFSDVDGDHLNDLPWHRPIQYVYDAAAERATQRIREQKLEQQQQAFLINGVH